MDIGKLRRWIRLKIDTIEASRLACLSQGDVHHQKGRGLQDEQARSTEWEEAERYHAAAKDLRDARYQDDTPPPVKNYTDSSVHGNTAPTLQANPRIDVSERTLSVIAFGLACGAFVTALWGIHESDFTRRHTEELRIRLEDAQSQLLAANCIKPGDAIHGPLANPDRLKEK